MDELTPGDHEIQSGGRTFRLVGREGAGWEVVLGDRLLGSVELLGGAYVARAAGPGPMSGTAPRLTGDDQDLDAALGWLVDAADAPAS